MTRAGVLLALLLALAGCASDGVDVPDPAEVEEPGLEPGTELDPGKVTLDAEASEWVLIYHQFAKDEQTIEATRTVDVAFRSGTGDHLMHVVVAPIQCNDADVDNPGPDPTISSGRYSIDQRVFGAQSSCIRGLASAFAGNAPWSLVYDVSLNVPLNRTILWRGEGASFRDAAGQQAADPASWTAEADVSVPAGSWLAIQPIVARPLEPLPVSLPVQATWEVTGICSDEDLLAQGWLDGGGLFGASFEQVVHAQVDTTGDIGPPMLRTVLIDLSGISLPADLRTGPYCA